MNNKSQNPLFAIFKNGTHKGNIRAISISQAINNYILDSGISESFLKDSNFINQYKAKKGLHYN
jgi:hypothetical protein